MLNIFGVLVSVPAMTKYLILGGLKQKCLPYSSGGPKKEVKEPGGLVPFGASEGDPGPYEFAGHPWLPFISL